jgi:hypothetical protein
MNNWKFEQTGKIGARPGNLGLVMLEWAVNRYKSSLYAWWASSVAVLTQSLHICNWRFSFFSRGMKEEPLLCRFFRLMGPWHPSLGPWCLKRREWFLSFPMLHMIEKDISIEFLMMVLWNMIRDNPSTTASWKKKHPAVRRRRYESRWQS